MSPVLESATPPWGKWEVVLMADYYKVKRLIVLPGRRMSYQYHEYRSEVWVVVHGVATVTLDDAVSDFKQGCVVDVPVGVKHRIANEQSDDLVIIEVQRGSYLGEDDIVRLEDDYRR